ncbi:E3 ubiquitin-protein ligase TRIM36-like [Mytilus trossulus]|uniref:E3 ubiquitin-protein ligase TRIM36-like n=1 Tax=Mytilus trossulus TaxID=6551 RepID=UPI003005D04A
MAQSADSTCLCEICIGGPGDYYCQQCDQLFCGNCKSSHLRTKISKKHTFFSGKNINKEEKRLCIEHEERFSFYCHDCETPVCSSCSVHTHQGHLLTDLTKSAVKLKLELVKIIESTITTSTSCIGKIEEDTKTYHQKTKTVNKTITEEGNYYKELIDKKVHSFVKLVQDETQKALGSMSTATKVYLDILENCQQWQKNITEMETKSDVLLVKKLKHLKTDVDQTVLKQSLDTPRPSVSYTNKKLSDTDIDNLFGDLTFQ